MEISKITDFASDERNIQSIQEILTADTLVDEISKFFTVIDGIKGEQQVGAISSGEGMLTHQPGCDPVYSEIDMKGYSQNWRPKELSLNKEICYTDLENSFLTWELSAGDKISNLAENTKIAKFFADYLSTGMQKDLLRLALLGDEAIDSTYAFLSSGEKAGLYNPFRKGLVPTLEYFKTIPLFKDNFVDLVKNGEATKSAQYTLEDKYSVGIYKDILDTIDFVGDCIISSDSLASNYTDFLKAYQLDSGKNEIMNGLKNLNFDGTKVISSKNYDHWRNRDFDNGTKIHMPHFAIYTNKTNLQLAFDSSTGIQTVKVIYDERTEKVLLKGKFKVDFKIVNPYLFKAAI